MSKIEHQLQVNDPDLSEPHGMDEINNMFFVVKDFKNRH